VSKKKSPAQSTAIRFKARRERGNDFCVIDTRRKNLTVATGLDRDEATETAMVWNARRTPQSVAAH
jgi:hypothetical protein